MTNIFIVIFGLIIIIGIIWNRFFRIREPINLDGLELDRIKMLSIGFLLLFFTLIFYYQLHLILQIKSKDNSIYVRLYKQVTNNVMMLYITAIIEKYILNAPKFTYEIISKYIPLTKFVEKTASPLVVYFYYPRVISLVCLIIPYIIVSSIFIIDVCYYHELNLFFKSLVVLILPLIVRVYLFVIENLSNKTLIFINLHLDFDLSPSDEGYMHVSFKKEQPTFEGAWIISPEFLDTAVMLWDIYSNINNYAIVILNQASLYKPYQLLFTSTCYILGWSYYLYLLVF